MNPNQGSFGAALPTGGDPIQEALMRRGAGGGGAPVTAQSSMTQTPVPGSVPTSNPAPATASMGSNPSPIAGMPPTPKESELIIRALTDRLKTFSKIEESQSIPPKPQGIGGL